MEDIFYKKCVKCKRMRKISLPRCRIPDCPEDFFLNYFSYDGENDPCDRLIIITKTDQWFLQRKQHLGWLSEDNEDYFVKIDRHRQPKGKLREKRTKEFIKNRDRLLKSLTKHFDQCEPTSKYAAIQVMEWFLWFIYIKLLDDDRYKHLITPSIDHKMKKISNNAMHVLNVKIQNGTNMDDYVDLMNYLLSLDLRRLKKENKERDLCYPLTPRESVMIYKELSEYLIDDVCYLVLDYLPQFS